MSNAKSIFEALNKSKREEDKLNEQNEDKLNEQNEDKLDESKVLSLDSKVDVAVCEKCDKTVLITENSALDCTCGNVMKYLTSFEANRLEELNLSIFEDGKFFNVTLEEISEKKEDKPSKEELMKRFGKKKAKPFDDDKKEDKKKDKDDEDDDEEDDKKKEDKKKEDKKKDDKKKNEDVDVEKDLEVISEKLQYLGILSEYKDDLKEKKADSLKKMLWENYYIKI